MPARPPEGHCAPPWGAVNEVNVGAVIAFCHLRSNAYEHQGNGIKILKSVRPGTLSHSIRP